MFFKTAVFFDVTPCNAVDGQRLLETCHLNVTVSSRNEGGGTGSSETSVSIYQTTQPNIPEARTLIFTAFFLHKSSRCALLIHITCYQSYTPIYYTTQLYLWATCFDCFQSSSGPTKSKSKAQLICRALWDPKRLHMIL